MKNDQRTLLHLIQVIRAHLLLVSFMMGGTAFAQDYVVKGKVSSAEENMGIPGVNIILKGTSTGTVTDSDGNYAMQLPDGSGTLIFSFIGYQPEEVSVNGQSVINVSLLPSVEQLSEIVVTALGIERESQSLGYAIQEVDGENLNEARETNFTNALAGKVAGLDVKSNTGVGSSSRVILRGESSLSINGNQPLFVVDGIPISNDINNTTSADYGNGASEINPADIESVNVLKGPAAAALYGSRAANGVIVITTKSGKNQKGLGISVNSSITFEDVLRLPKFQNEFGGGSNGLFEGSNFGYQGNLDLYPNGIQDGYDESWGPRLNFGPNRAQFDSPTTNGFRGGDVHLRNRGDIIPTPWVSQPDNVEDFFDLGQTLFNNVAVAGSNDKGNFRLSYTNLDQKGIVPNNDLKRNTIALNTSYHLTDNFRADLSLSYIKTTSTNRPEQGYGRNTPMYFMLWMTRQVNMNSLRDYWQPGLEGVQQFQYNYGENHNNPFFYQYENTSGQLKDHLLGKIALTYDFDEHWSLMVRTGTDLYNDFRPIRQAVSTVGNEKGRYQESDFYFEERNSDFLLKYDLKSTGKFGMIISAGANRLDQNRRSNTTVAPELLIPGIYNLGNNAAPLQTSEYIAKKRINSVYGLAQFDYNNMLFLDVTARNDWSSTLPEDNNSYFYPSVSFSALFNEIFDLPQFVDLAQLRLGWAEVGNDTGPYQLYNSFNYELPWGSELALSEPSALKNPQLKPESISTYEIGANVKLFDNRLGIDFTYYDIRSKDQILNIPLTETSGYSSRVINAGEIKNQGIELMLTATPVRLQNSFQWDLSVNFAKNNSEVVALAEGIGAFVQSAPGEEATVEARVGERMGALYGPGFERVPDGPMKGEMIIGVNGLPIKTTEPIYLGNFNPDWTAGISNTLSFKGIYARALFDFRQGGAFISRMYNKGMGAGILEESALERAARAPGTEYDAPYYHAGAVLNDDGTYTQNLISTDGTASEGIYGTGARNYYKQYFDHNSEAQLMDASYVKLREVAVGYTLPQNLLGSFPLKNIRVSFVGRNLKLWTDNPHFDPETSMATTGGGLIPGFENMSLPSTKSWGFNLSFNL
jgi:TonB-linked SusC/RagA family outer membrane protein